MPKKHRVKRQKYVEYLLKLEKERDAYLAKRKNNKRNRQARLAEESMGDARERAEVLPPQKRHRTEIGTAEASMINKNIDNNSGTTTSFHLLNGVDRENDQYDSSTNTKLKQEDAKILEKNSALRQETAEMADHIENTKNNSPASNSFFSTNAKSLLQNGISSSTKMSANNNDERKNVEISNRVKKTIKRRY